MVINADAEFERAKRKFDEAKTPEEKLRALQEMLKYAPKHKGAQNLLAWIKKEIKKYRKLVQESKKKGGRSYHVKKVGDLIISIVGIENSGKSYMLKKFTGLKVESTPIPFETIEAVTGVKNYKGVRFQLVEIPSSMERRFLTTITISDLIIILLKPEDIKSQLQRIQEYVSQVGIYLSKSNKVLFVVNGSEGQEKDNVIYVKDFGEEEQNRILDKVLQRLDLIRVFPKDSDHAVVLKRGSKVRDFIEEVNDRWLDGFLYAKIWRDEKVIRVGLEYELKDGDKIEIKAKLS